MALGGWINGTRRNTLPTRRTACWKTDARWWEFAEDIPIDQKCLELLGDEDKRLAHITRQKAFVKKHLDISGKPSAERCAEVIGRYAEARNIKRKASQFKDVDYRPAQNDKIGTVAIVAPQIGNVSETPPRCLDHSSIFLKILQV